MQKKKAAPAKRPKPTVEIDPIPVRLDYVHIEYNDEGNVVWLIKDWEEDPSAAPRPLNDGELKYCEEEKERVREKLKYSWDFSGRCLTLFGAIESGYSSLKIP